MDRRDFLEKGAGAFAAAAALGDDKAVEPRPRVRRRRRGKEGHLSARRPSSRSGRAARETLPQAANGANPDPAAVLPRRTLGRTGVEVTILNLGTWMSPGGERLLRFAWANGVRYVDTAKSYGSEPMIGRWLQAMPEPRKDLFLVTKDQPEYAPAAHRATRPAARGAPDRLRRPDLPPRPGRPRTSTSRCSGPGARSSRRPPRRSASRARRSSSASRPIIRAGPCSSRPPCEGGFVDAIMLQNNPWIAQEDDDEPRARRLLQGGASG